MTTVHTPDAETGLIELWKFDAAARCGTKTIVEYDRYIGELRRHIHPTPLTDATAMMLRQFLLSNANRWSPGTLSVARRAIRSLYRWLHENDLVAENPAASIPAVKTPETLVRSADVGVRDQLLATATWSRDRALIALLFCGPRRGEVLRLTVDDVSIEHRTFVIAKTKVGKVRVAPMDSVATEAMAEWLDERAELHPTTTSVWVRSDGSVLTENGGKTLIRRLARRAGVEFSSHDARRGFAERWLTLKGSETSLSAICGWAPGSPMLSRYVRTNREKIAHQEAFDLLG